MLLNAHEHIFSYLSLEEALNIIEKNKIISLACSMNPEEYDKLKEIAKNNLYIKKGFGIHPWDVEYDTDLSSLEKFIIDCDFIGEIGLDYYWDERKELYPKQRLVFEYFLKMSKKYNKVTNIHTKGAEDEVLNLLKKYQLENQIIHWYSGPLKFIEDYLKLNSFFTISSDIGYSEITDELIKIIPLENLLTETDGPKALEWVNGSYSKPSFVKNIIKHIGKIKNINTTSVEDQIFKNYLKLKI